MAEASEGIWIWDTLEDAYFVCQAWITLGLGDMLGSAKINGMAGHGGIYGDCFSMVQAAKTSDQSSSCVQYYTMLNIDHFNPDHHNYSFDDLPMCEYNNYFDVLLKLDQASSKAEQERITQQTGILQLPLCAASAAFFHPFFFPIDPFHLFYKNMMAFVWDLWTIQKHCVSGEIFRLAPVVVATLGRLVEAVMFTLPPAFCGPVRNPHFKRQSQYKIYEWMALLHWYIVPMTIELGFHFIVIRILPISSGVLSLQWHRLPGQRKTYGTSASGLWSSLQVLTKFMLATTLKTTTELVFVCSKWFTSLSTLSGMVLSGLDLRQQ